MERKNEAHELVIKCLVEALMRLMEKKPFEDISISELCALAGVSRVSFYRNYNSMDEILIKYLTQCTDDWFNEFIKRPEDEFYESFWPELLNEYKRHNRLIKLLAKNNMFYVLREHVFSCCGPVEGISEREAYTRAVLAGAISGMVEQWIRTGMKGTPDILDFKKMSEMVKQ